MRTANPALGENTFKDVAYSPTAEAMTIQGTVNKTAILLLLVVLPASWVWGKFFATNDPASVSLWVVVGMVGGLVLGLVTVFKQTWAPITAPLYSVFQGLLLGGISAIAEASYPGIVFQAVGLTFGTCLAMLAAYSSGVIKATENFKLGIVAATGGIFLVYLATMILGIFGVKIPLIHDSGLVGIGFSLFVVVIAALNLVLDFDFIEQGANLGAPKFMEWYGAFGLMVTLIWLYIEILRLLMKLRSRN